MSGYSTGTNNRLSTDGTYNYTYDDEGNRLTKTNISTGDKEEYTWDWRNRLTNVTFKDSGNNVVKTVAYAYDYLNQLIRRTLDADGAGSGTATDTFYSNEGGQIALKFDGSTAGDLSNRYFWNPAAVDQLLADEQVSSLSTAGDILWTLTDHQGTIQDLASHNSGTHATTIDNHREYDSYGNLTSETNSAVDEIFGYTGRLLDEATSLQNNLNRWYDSDVGRWLNEDPIEFKGGDTNLYRYAGNSTLFNTDPNGLSILSIPLPVPVPSPLPPPFGALLIPHGRYCGYNNPPAAGWKFCNGTVPKPDNQLPDGLPWDELDRACLSHDCCLGTPARFRSIPAQCSCGVELCLAALKPTACTGSPSPMGCERKRGEILQACKIPFDILIPPIIV